MSDRQPTRFAKLSGRRSVVTGASSGIGRAIALELARAGSDVGVHYANSEQDAKATASEIERLGVRAILLQGDLTQDGPGELVDRAWEELGSIDVWVNNAGADVLTGKGAQLTFDEKLALLWQVDVAGTVHLSREVAGRMKQNGKGTILTIGWDQADRGMEGESAELFSATKNAVMGFTRALALSAAPEVRVNCIAPGWIRTSWGEGASAAWQERVLRETPLGRWGTPEDIARLARFLASDDAAYITGQVINANGGAVR